MLSLPLITPRDSHDLWFPSSVLSRTPTTHHSPTEPSISNTSSITRRHGSTTQYRPIGAASGPNSSAANTLASLINEERALRTRKNNIASFGCSWIKPAGVSKTMLGIKEEEAEREEALAAADAEFAAAAAAAAAAAGGAGGMGIEGEGGEEEGEEDEGMERDLDADIPDADADGFHGDDDDEDEEDGVEVDGLVEDGEEGLEEDDEEEFEHHYGGIVVEEREYYDMDPDEYEYPGPPPYGQYDGGEEEEGEGDDFDFDNQPDLDGEIPSADGGMEERDLDDDIPEAEEDEWQHTDTDAEIDDDDDDDDNNGLGNDTHISHDRDPFSESTASSTRGLPSLPQAPNPHRHLHRQQQGRETEAQRRFLQRWSGGGDVLDTSSMMVDDEDGHDFDLRASITSQTSRRSSGGSVFGRFPRRRDRVTGPRDSLE